MTAASASLLTGALAMCLVSMDLALSIVYRKVSARGDWKTGPMVVFTAVGLGVVFFQVVDSWSALTFSQGVYTILSYIWRAILTAAGGFVMVFVPYFTCWLIAKPWRNPYKTIFIVLGILFVAFGVLDIVLGSDLWMALDSAIGAFVVAFCAGVMLKNRKSVSDKDVRAMVRTTGIVALCLLPFIIASVFIRFLASIAVQVYALGAGIVVMVFLFLLIDHALKRAEEEKAGVPEKVDLSQWHITEREEEVIGLVAEGMTNKEIAAQLGLSVNTVNNHMANIFSKTGVRSRVDLLNLVRRGAW